MSDVKGADNHLISDAPEEGRSVFVEDYFGSAVQWRWARVLWYEPEDNTVVAVMDGYVVRRPWRRRLPR